MKKFIGLLVLVASLLLLPLATVSASSNISVNVRSFTSENAPAPVTNSYARGVRFSINNPNQSVYSFAYYALNGIIGEQLPSGYEFNIKTKTDVDAYFHTEGQFVVIFADSNGKVLDVEYVASGATVSTTQANTAASGLTKIGLTLNETGTRWLTKDEVTPAAAITGNRVFYAQYTPTITTEYALTVVGGTGDKATYVFNEVATATAPALNGEVPFSHWEDSEGNVLSNKLVYKFTMYKVTTITAIFNATAEYPHPVVNMSEAINIRSAEGKVSYLGQFDLPAGYELIEYGFIFSRSSMVLTLESAGITVAQSNVHNGTTKEFLMTFNNTLFNSARAYLIVKNSSNVIEEYYSQNVFRDPVSIGESSIVLYNPTTNNTGYAPKSVEVNSLEFRLNGTQVTNTSGKGVTGSYFAMNPSSANASPLDQAHIEFTANQATLISFLIAPWTTTETGRLSKFSFQGYINGVWTDLLNLLPLVPGTVEQTHLVEVSVSGGTYRIYSESTNASDSRVIVDEISITNTIHYTGPIHEVVYNNESVLTDEMVKDSSTISYTPSKTGYTFNGWYTNSGLTVAHNNAPITQSITLYAKYTINNYTISFEPNGGTAVTEITQAYNTPISSPSNPTREGYSFAGWSQAVPANMPAENVTLTAQWTINSYTITFNSNGGSEVTEITQNFGTSVSAPSNPTKPGFSFVRWFVTDSGVAYTFSTMPSSNLTLNALWEEVIGTSYTVTFNSNGGTSVSPIVVLEDELATLPNPAPTRTGYTFFRWETENNQAWNFASDLVTEDITLYAVWNLVTYHITYENLQSTTHSNPANYNIETTTITLTNPSARSGFNFAGWFDQLTGGNQVTQIVLGSTENRTLYARWNEILPIVLRQSDFGTTNFTTNTYATVKTTSVLNGPLDTNPSGSSSWETKGSNFNSSSWDFVRMGGLSASSKTDPQVYMKTNYTFSSIINSIKINIVGLDSATGSEKIYLQISSDGTTWTDVTNLTITSTGLLTFDSLNIASGNYIRFVFERASTGSNVGTDVKTITFYQNP